MLPTVPCQPSLFSVRRGGAGAQVEVVQSRPQVDHVPLLAARGVEAAERVALKVDAEGATAAIATADRAGAALLRPSSFGRFPFPGGSGSWCRWPICHRWGPG